MVTLRDQNAIVEAPATWYNRALANEAVCHPPADTKELNVFLSGWRADAAPAAANPVVATIIAS
jgi:hypothetical protein